MHPLPPETIRRRHQGRSYASVQGDHFQAPRARLPPDGVALSSADEVARLQMSAMGIYRQLTGPVAASTIELARGDAPLRTDTDLKLWIGLLVLMILRCVFDCLRLRQQSISFS